MAPSIGNYRIVRQLGQGGMGAVFEAVHLYIGRQAAVKVLHPDLSRNQQYANRFLNEARAVNLIKHPGLVEIFEFGILDGGTAYIIMELLEGESLAQHLRRQPGGLGDTALGLCRKIAQAMAAAHQKGIVHRDLKPDNVMLVADVERPGELRPKVLDFGIAKLSSQSDGRVRTETGAMIGTPAYMSPEQCVGDPNVDGKADVYALGVMLYEMLAGELPFDAEHSFDFMAAHVRAEPRPLRQVLPSVPEEVENLVHSMLTKQPAERPSMEAVVAILEQLCAATPTLWPEARNSGRQPRLSKEMLALDVTLAGSQTPVARPSREVIEHSATVAGPVSVSGGVSGARLARELAERMERAAQSEGAPARPSRDAIPIAAVRSQERAAVSAPSLEGTPLPTPTPAGTLRSAVVPPSSLRWPVLALAALGIVAAVIVGGRLLRPPEHPVALAPVVAAAPRMVRWSVRSQPAGAQIVRQDGQVLGTTPWEVERPAEPGETVLTLRHPGYQPLTLAIGNGAELRTEIPLVPEAAPPAEDKAADSKPAKRGAKARKHERPISGSEKGQPAGDDVKLLLD